MEQILLVELLIWTIIHKTLIIVWKLNFELLIKD
jgi:hypothetical protein